MQQNEIQSIIRSAVAQTLSELPPQRVAYTVRQAAEAVGLPYSTLRDRVASGELPAVKRAGKWLILHADLLRWLGRS